MGKMIDFCDLNIKNAANAELCFYGDIVSSSWERFQYEDTCPENIRSVVEIIGDRDIDIHINSPGGNVMAGLTIYNMLKNARGRKRVYIDGCAASIAAVIAMCGDEIIMPQSSFLMVHKPMVTVVDANADELSELINTLDKIESGIISVFLTKARDGVGEDEIREYLKAETWFSADEATEVFDTVTIDGTAKLTDKINVGSFKNYKNVPKQILNSLKQPNFSEFSDFLEFTENMYPKN